jgi:hypothetical protein
MLISAQRDSEIGGKVFTGFILDGSADTAIAYSDGRRCFRGYLRCDRCLGNRHSRRLSERPCVVRERTQVFCHRPHLLVGEIFAKGLDLFISEADDARQGHCAQPGHFALVSVKVSRAVRTVFLEEILSSLNLFIRCVQRHDVGHHIPAFLVAEADKWGHETVDLAARDCCEPTCRRGRARDLWQRKGRDRDAQLDALHAVAETSVAVTGCTFFKVDHFAVCHIWRLRRNQYQSGYRCRRNIIRWRRDILGQRHVTRRKDCGEYDKKNDSKFHGCPLRKRIPA